MYQQNYLGEVECGKKGCVGRSEDSTAKCKKHVGYLRMNRLLRSYSTMGWSKLNPSSALVAGETWKRGILASSSKYCHFDSPAFGV
jgi:hypothetical protein